MRSVVVVFPASMCAMIPMFRSFSSRAPRSSCFTATAAISLIPPIARLVPEVAEGLVGLSHAVSFFLALHGSARVVAGVQQLMGEPLRHAAAAALPREPHDPAASERQPAVRSDLDRDLVRRAPHAPGLDLEQRRGVAKGQVEDFDRLLLGLPAGLAQ